MTTSSAHEGLLNRPHAEASVRELFGDPLDVLRELIDEATHLQVRAMTTSARGTADVVILGTFFSRTIKLLDSIEVLSRAGQAYGARIPLRVLLEGAWGLEWMLKSDTTRRGRQYYVVDQRNLIAENESFIPGTRAYERFCRDVDPGKRSELIPADFEERARAEVKRLRDHILSEPELSEINDEIDKHKKSDVRWFQLYGGPASYRDLAQALGRGEEYQMSYAGLSHAVHGSARQDHVYVERSGLARLVNIRAIDNLTNVLDLTWILALRTYRLVLMHYRPGEFPAFRSRFFVDDESRFVLPEVEIKQELKVL